LDTVSDPATERDQKKKTEAKSQPKSSTNTAYYNLREGEGERWALCALCHRILSYAAIEWRHERGTKNRN
jgi:hypothetical protein